MIDLASTKEIVARSDRKESVEAFFAIFPTAWDGVRSQVAKLETRQEYQEPDNPSWQALAQGNWEDAVRILPEVRADDWSLYKELDERGVEFLRCRPLVFPLNQYVRWEFEAYKLNAAHGERIFCCNRISLDAVFDKHAQHDFMVFDARLAVIHDYDSDGLLQGGWHVHDPSDVQALISLFAYIKANCQPYHLFIDE